MYNTKVALQRSYLGVSSMRHLKQLSMFAGLAALSSSGTGREKAVEDDSADVALVRQCPCHGAEPTAKVI